MPRKRGQGLPRGESKKGIIEYILSTPEFEVEEPDLRRHLGDKYDIHDTKNIKNLLKDLSKKECISKVSNPGKENKWKITDNRQFENIFYHFEDLLPVLQENDKIMSMLVDLHFKQIHAGRFSDVTKIFRECKECLKYPQRPDFIDCNYTEEKRKKCNELEKRNPFEYTDASGFLNDRKISKIHDFIKEMENSENEFKNKFKERLRMSPYFFKTCLTNTPDQLEKIFKKILTLMMDEHAKNADISDLDIALEKGLLEYFDKIFEICVYVDIINRKANETAIEYVFKMSRMKD